MLSLHVNDIQISPSTIDMARGHLWGSRRTGYFIHDVSHHLDGDAQYEFVLGFHID